MNFTEEYAPINLIVLSFVGRAASEQRRREFEFALEQAKSSAGLQFSQIKTVHEKLGQGGRADALQALGVHVLVDDQSAIVCEAQKTGCAAFRNFPNFGPSGFGNALESMGEFIESRDRNSIPAAGFLLPCELPRGAPSFCVPTAPRSGPSIAFLASR